MAMTPEEQATIVAELQKRLGPSGMQGFGDIKTDPAANAAAKFMAGNSPDDFAAGMALERPSNLAAAGGGVMSPFEAAANGMKTAFGMGMMGKNMKNRQNALSSLLRKPGADSGITGTDFSLGDAQTTPLMD